MQVSEVGERGAGATLTVEQREAVTAAVRSSREAQGLAVSCQDATVGRVLGVVLKSVE